MKNEWIGLTEMASVAIAQQNEWEIEVQIDAGNDKYCPFKEWNQETWSKTYLFRGRPRQPKMKKLKLSAYMHIGVGEICYRFAGETFPKNWIRIPSEDKEIEVQDDN